MYELVTDFKTHPLVPGSLLASIAGDPQIRRLQPFDSAQLLKFNKLISLEVAGELQNTGRITAEQSTKLLAVDGQFVRYYRDLTLNLPEVAPRWCVRGNHPHSRKARTAIAGSFVLRSSPAKSARLFSHGRHDLTQRESVHPVFDPADQCSVQRGAQRPGIFGCVLGRTPCRKPL